MDLLTARWVQLGRVDTKCAHARGSARRTLSEGEIDHPDTRNWRGECIANHLTVKPGTREEIDSRDDIAKIVPEGRVNRKVAAGCQCQSGLNRRDRLDSVESYPDSADVAAIRLPRRQPICSYILPTGSTSLSINCQRRDLQWRVVRRDYCPAGRDFSAGRRCRRWGRRCCIGRGRSGRAGERGRDRTGRRQCKRWGNRRCRGLRGRLSAGRCRRWCFRCGTG